MGDEAAEAALLYLRDNASDAGVRKAQMHYLEHFRKVVLARLKLQSTARSDAARDDEARASDEYEQVCVALREAEEAYELMYWKRIAAEATLESWRTRSANQRGAGKMQ